MNKRDREFYEYLNNLPTEVFDQWLEAASQEELDWADRLFDEVKFDGLDKVEDLTEAKNILKQFTLKG